MKKWTLRLLLILTLYLIIPKFRFHYFYSKHGDQVLTQVTFPNIPLINNTSYFTPGKYSSFGVPEVYVKPIRGNFNDWDEVIYFHSKGILIQGSNSETKGLTDSFNFSGGEFTTYKDFLATRKIIDAMTDMSMTVIHSFTDDGWQNHPHL
jgi:hypothetical protein